MDALLGDVQHVSGLSHAEPAVKAELNHAGFSLIESSQLRECLFQRDELRFAAGGRERFVEGDTQRLAASFARHARPGGFDQNAPHDARANREEVGTILPSYIGDIDQSHVGFVHQCGGLKRVFSALLIGPDRSHANNSRGIVAVEGLRH